MKLKINSPVTLNTLEPIASYEEAQGKIAMGILVLNTLMCMRAQITYATNSSMTTKEIQGLDSQKQIAKLFNGQVVDNLLFYNSLCQTLFANIEEFSQEGFDFDHWAQEAQKEIKSASGRIIPESQLSNDPQVISIHRRGLMAKTRGQAQTTPIFTPSTVITGGINPLTITMKGVIEATRASCEVIGINLEDQIPKFPKIQSGDLDNNETLTTLVGYCIFNGGNLEGDLEAYMDKGRNSNEILFGDSITLSDHPDNLLPIEASLTNNTPLKLVRTKTPTPVEIKEGALTPLAAAAAKQAKKFNDKLKLGKNITPKKAPTPPTGGKKGKGKGTG